MKKTYSKPDILFESFALSTSIAAGCDFKPNGATTDCGVLWGHSVIFLSGMNACTSKVLIEGENQYNNICYHNPYADRNVFFS